MNSKATIAAIVLVFCAAPILAQEAGVENSAQPAPAPVASAQTQGEAAAETDPGEEIICRRDRTTGSLTRVTRVCKTRNEWNNTHARTRDNMNDLQRNASGGSSCRQDQAGGC